MLCRLYHSPQGRARVFATDFHGRARITLEFLLMCVLRWIDDTMGFVHGSFFVLFPGGWS